MIPILVAHGTRKAHGVEMVGELADRVSAVVGRRVRTAFVDVLGPTPADVLRTLPDDVPAVLVPAQDTVRVVVERLLESGWQSSDSVVLAAAGTSDPNAQRDLRVTAALLSAALGQRVELAYAATGEPSVGSAVAGLRDRGARRVVVASYLLADGLFQDRLRASGADVVAEPLGTHPGVVRLIASRFRRAVLPVAA